MKILWIVDQEHGRQMEQGSPNRTRCIRDVIHAEEDRLRAKYPWLACQDLVGMACFVGSLVTMAAVAWLYLQGMIAWWAAIPLMAFPLSILHELEHDLIHDMYFRTQPWVQNVMFSVIWLSKLSLNPWYRRGIHIKHHQVSGQEGDIEERLIGLGLPSGLLRLIVTIHPMGALLLFPRIKRDVPDFQPWRLTLLSLPTYSIFFWTWEIFSGYIRVRNGWTLPYDPALLLPVEGWALARDLTVLWILPNVLRQSSLVLMSSYSHYYGDIPERDVYFQNQILNSWLVFPMQLFCFNFGETHIIHHYVINQPFYLRQMVARVSLAEMQRRGTRVNDLGTFVRANRWGDNDAVDESAPGYTNEQLPLAG